MATIAIEQLPSIIGQSFASEWVLVDQAMIDAFAAATGDHQFIHVDPVAAAQTPFGGTIAHGFLTLSLMPMLMERSDVPRPAGIRMGVNYGCNALRFLTPVRSGSRVRGHFKPLSITEKRPGQFQQVTEFTVEIEGSDKPALAAEWISQFFI
ncbi:MaoC family dehydratase [Sphingomonas sp. KR1UV-12]|uniref:MaoC family dehydratase n=1 Tax=Sphingomonas aurea TaxID=3063994 RepID=A0ABT9EG53_9SPHN|nr:MaoC family dehydratase [Sphingomonas sp. KR1UV-12]MDP1025820.1 MaoC family dehydratase [Sphingomonas sp. KR1UV-12]